MKQTKKFLLSLMFIIIILFFYLAGCLQAQYDLPPVFGVMTGACAGIFSITIVDLINKNNDNN